MGSFRRSRGGALPARWGRGAGTAAGCAEGSLRWSGAVQTDLRECACNRGRETARPPAPARPVDGSLSVARRTKKGRSGGRSLRTRRGAGRMAADDDRGRQAAGAFFFVRPLALADTLRLYGSTGTLPSWHLLPCWRGGGARSRTFVLDHSTTPACRKVVIIPHVQGYLVLAREAEEGEGGPGWGRVTTGAAQQSAAAPQHHGGHRRPCAAALARRRALCSTLGAATGGLAQGAPRRARQRHTRGPPPPSLLLLLGEYSMALAPNSHFI